MSKVRYIGIGFLLAGFIGYFLTEEEPYTTIAGFLAGVGFVLTLVGDFSKLRKDNL